MQKSCTDSSLGLHHNEHAAVTGWTSTRSSQLRRATLTPFPSVEDVLKVKRKKEFLTLLQGRGAKAKSTKTIPCKDRMKA